MKSSGQPLNRSLIVDGFYPVGMGNEKQWSTLKSITDGQLKHHVA